MSAWTTGLASAPTDRMIMVELDGWQAPAFMRWEPPDDTHDGFWSFCDELIADASEPLDADEIAQAKWAIVPS